MTTLLDEVRDEAGVRALGAALARDARVGDTFLLEGPLGAGKTTLVRAFLGALGWTETVRSPTFTLMQLYPTDPPVLHADLYRLSHAEGIGLEDELNSRVSLIEWPDRLQGLVDPATATQIRLQFAEEGHRRVTVTPPIA